jgi:hypothetical protein
MSLLAKLLQKSSFHDTCGSAAKRAALKAELTPANTSEEVSGDLKVTEGEDRIIEAARVSVKGNLIIEDQAARTWWTPTASGPTPRWRNTCFGTRACFAENFTRTYGAARCTRDGVESLERFQQ